MLEQRLRSSGACGGDGCIFEGRDKVATMHPPKATLNRGLSAPDAFRIQNANFDFVKSKNLTQILILAR